MNKTYINAFRFLIAIIFLSHSHTWGNEYITPNADVVSHVIVRAEASGNSRKIGKLFPNDHAPYLGSVSGWYKVQLPDEQVGFVYKRWTEFKDEAVGFDRKEFKVHFIDVGVGDAAIIDMGDKEIVIDGGNYPNDLSQYNKQNNIIDGEIELLIVTHGDQDHWKGLQKLLGFVGAEDDAITVGEFWDPGYNRDCNGDAPGRVNYLAFVDSVKQSVAPDHFKRPLELYHTPFDLSKRIEPFSIPSLPRVKFTLLHSLSTPTESECSYMVNDASIVVMIEIDGIKMLFSGDANGKERIDSGDVASKYTEGSILAAASDMDRKILKADLLKAPHHGSETANTQSFIDAVDPTFVIFSASTNHHLPKDTVIDRYESNYRVMLRTDFNRERMKDHIVCGFEDSEFNCLYAADLQ